MEVESPDQRSPLAALRRFARATTIGQSAEKCELCSIRLPAEHQHLLDLRTRRLVCCCQPCGLLFSGRKSAVYRRVLQTVRSLPDFRLSDAQWESLLIPINLAFFYRSDSSARQLSPQYSVPSTQEGQSEVWWDQRAGTERSLVGERRPTTSVIAVYPSPAGPVESLLALDGWQAIVDDNPRLGDLQPEVEALLANRLSGKQRYYLVPIDHCYRLSGLIRLHWRGLSGGSEVWEEVGRYFDRLEEKASCSI
jgi:hypothetical protein